MDNMFFFFIFVKTIVNVIHKKINHISVENSKVYFILIISNWIKQNQMFFIKKIYMLPHVLRIFSYIFATTYSVREYLM